ncbi:hypothetical protein Y032_1006g3371 [Ancylostoma ceylanicum]|uniref:Uncharacterized protein n=1 Tax=Ancylostoma ceylanicum TaxID=53326 RepID=A0A016W9H1_9BILA|nr:hypothetical protein Y032_1006g3371 [Ancylostoma ceylanicum]
MARAMMKIASYDLPKRFGWIMVEGTGTNTDEKLDDAFGQLMEKLKKVRFCLSVKQLFAVPYEHMKNFLGEKPT